MIQPLRSWVNVSCRNPTVRKVSVSLVFFCSWVSSALKYFGRTSLPFSSIPCKVSSRPWILAPIAQEAAPGVAGEVNGFAADGGVDGVGVPSGGGVEVLCEECSGVVCLTGEVTGGGFICMGKCPRRWCTDPRRDAMCLS